MNFESLEYLFTKHLLIKDSKKDYFKSNKLNFFAFQIYGGEKSLIETLLWRTLIFPFNISCMKTVSFIKIFRPKYLSRIKIFISLKKNSVILLLSFSVLSQVLLPFYFVEYQFSMYILTFLKFLCLYLHWNRKHFKMAFP